MSTEVFIPYKPHTATLVVVDQANAIIEEYLAQGFSLTLRQLFYQFAARALLPNLFKEYKRLGTIIRNARDGGLVDWDAIEDRTREVNTHTFWTNPAGIISTAAHQYREDLWAGQRYRPEVWIEKEALLGVVEGVCTELRVPYFAHRGNNSQTLQYQAGKRFARYLDQGLIPWCSTFSTTTRTASTCRGTTRTAGALYSRTGRGAAHRTEHGPGSPVQPAAELRERWGYPDQRIPRTLRYRSVLGTGCAQSDGDLRPHPRRA